MSESEVVIERLTAFTDQDIAQLNELAPYLSERFTGQTVKTEVLAAIIDSPDQEQLVARVRGRIVGAATMSLTRGWAAGEKGCLNDFVTHPDERGKGLGDKVWSEMIAWCKESGIGLEFTSHPKRAAAHAFYLKHGATVRETTVFEVEVTD